MNLYFVVDFNEKKWRQNMRCDLCGVKIKEKASFCTNCGAIVKKCEEVSGLPQSRDCEMEESKDAEGVHISVQGCEGQGVPHQSPRRKWEENWAILSCEESERPEEEYRRRSNH
jgi:hypothetical protein